MRVMVKLLVVMTRMTRINKIMFPTVSLVRLE